MPDDSRLPIAIIGTGRMGAALVALAPEHGCDVVATIGAAHNADGAGITAETLHGARVAIEFSVPASAPANIRACARVACPVVVGTTGWQEERSSVERDVRALGGAMLAAGNFSIGANIFFAAARDAAARFARATRFDAHIVETHHAKKLDAPSGTALTLKRGVDAALGRDVPITSVRVGSVPGTHELIFDGAYEQVRLAHDVRDRRVFAEGALIAARWLAGRTGVFTIDDVLGASAATTRTERA
jgi:4-hydroxy-tetrahydrodipicolinate reductase